MDQHERTAVIVIAYNRPRYLEEALWTVAMQTRSPHEVVVVDDASPRPLRSAIQIPEGLQVRFVRQPVNQGPAAAARRGLRESHSELVAFLNDDDVWDNTFLEYLGAALAEAPEAALAFADHYVMDVDGKIDMEQTEMFSALYKRAQLEPGLVTDLPRVGLIDGSVNCGSFALVRRRELDPDIIAAGGDVWDYFVTLSACRSGRPGIYVRQRLGTYRLSPDGVTARNRDSARRLASTAKLIFASRLILKSPALGTVHRASRRTLIRLCVRFVLNTARLGDMADKRAALQQLALALRAPVT